MRSQLLLTIGTGLLLSAALKAQPLNNRSIPHLKDSATSATSDSLRISYLSRIAIAYYHQRQDIHHWHDSSRKYQQLALELSEKKGNTYWKKVLRSVEANNYWAMGQHTTAMTYVGRMHDTDAVQNLLDWGSIYNGVAKYYSFNMDSALYFYQQALVIAERRKNTVLLSKVYPYLAYYYSRKEDTLSVKQIAEKIIPLKKNDAVYMCSFWYGTGAAMPILERNFAFKRYCYQQAIGYSTKPENAASVTIKTMAARAYMALGDIYDVAGNDSLARTTYLRSLDMHRAVNDKGIYAIYCRLHSIFYYAGNFDKAMEYGVEALKGAEAAGVRNLQVLYLFLGNCCLEMGQPARSIGYFEKSLASARNSDRVASGSLLKKMVKALVATGRTQEALPFVQQALKTYRFPTSGDSMIIQEALANCYNALKQYDLAEKYYRQMADYLPRVDPIFAATYPFAWAKYYYEQGQYDNAKRYMKQCLALPRGHFPRFAASELYLMLYKIDSTHGQHQTALRHYLDHRLINDTIFSAKQKQELEALRLQFDLEKKDFELQLNATDIKILTKEKLLQQTLASQTQKDALLKQQNIDLLMQQAEMQKILTGKQAMTLQQQQKEILLQQENIGLLRSHDLLQSARLKQADFIRQLTIGGVLLLLIIVGLLYGRYRARKKTNQQISEKNERLEQLLEEKEWLLKEVHHRVKNNLQVVHSLLQSQSIFLQDEALAAVHVSQHRVQAMSLIHQKLYHANNVSAVEMGSYVPELIVYLQDSFPNSNHIRFVLDVASITLDVKQAIPLGLIINEAVTNSFKHAFPDQQRAQIMVSLQWRTEEEIVLDIKDNGVGIQHKPSNVRKGSLGMSLMKGLCSDFHACCNIHSDNGTHIQVTFPAILQKA